MIISYRRLAQRRSVCSIRAKRLQDGSNDNHPQRAANREVFFECFNYKFRPPGIRWRSARPAARDAWVNFIIISCFNHFQKRNEFWCLFALQSVSLINVYEGSDPGRILEHYLPLRYYQMSSLAKGRVFRILLF
ncbi:hypothetical protein MJ575_11850 [Klebsiella pneumoniae]|nr:hypothetical protein MJ575_11850 [Klebsiella pneumoniae]